MKQDFTQICSLYFCMLWVEPVLNHWLHLITETGSQWLPSDNMCKMVAYHQYNFYTQTIKTQD